MIVYKKVIKMAFLNVYILFNLPIILLQLKKVTYCLIYVLVHIIKLEYI